MSTPLARFSATRATGRITWRSVLGILLVPLVVAGVLVWAFWNPAERLDTVNAAIVNLDEPVELDGQQVPLGRQLAAGLVGGGSTETSEASGATASASGTDLDDTNYNWVLTDEDDADAGLKSGKYTAVVTIPENFSQAATSFSGDAADAEKATIDVETSDKSRLVDDAISSVITTTAASVVGNELTTTYLENLYVGFNTLGEQLGTAADGATELATGATSLADGASQLAAGTTEFSGGVSSLSSGINEYTDGVSGLASGLTTLQQRTAGLPAVTQQLAGGATKLSTGVDALVDGLAKQNEVLAQISAQCPAVSLSPEYCDGLDALVAASATPEAKAQTDQLKAGARDLASGATQLAAGMPALTSGIAQAASGATELAAAGSTVNAGALELATGAADLATGATGVSDGAAGLAGGVGTLASGLGEATEAIPSYTETERETLAEVVATPIVAEGSNGGLSFGTTGVPFFAALALWLGAFASFLVLLAMPKRALGSTRPSAFLAFKAWLPGALVGVAQGVLVAAILQPLMELDVAGWFSFAAVAALAGIAFASTNQALNAVLGGAGRFLSMIIALVLIGTSIIATAPAALDSAVGILPLQPALNAFQSVVSGGGGLAPAIVGLVLWTLAAFAVTTLAVVKSRSVTARQLVPRLA